MLPITKGLPGRGRSRQTSMGGGEHPGRAQGPLSLVFVGVYALKVGELLSSALGRFQGRLERERCGGSLIIMEGQRQNSLCRRASLGLM
jgi:hypothetical protein